MLRMLTLPGSLLRVLEVFRPCFTTPTFASFATLPAGMVARPTHRTVCGMLASAGVAGVWHHSRAHRFFAAARWHPDAVGLTVLRLVVGHLVPVGAPLMSLSGLRFGRSVWVDSGPVGAPPEVDSGDQLGVTEAIMGAAWVTIWSRPAAGPAWKIANREKPPVDRFRDEQPTKGFRAHHLRSGVAHATPGRGRLRRGAGPIPLSDRVAVAGARAVEAGGAHMCVSGGWAHLPQSGRGQRHPAQHLPYLRAGGHQGAGAAGVAADRGGASGRQGRLAVPDRGRGEHPDRAGRRAVHQETTLVSGKHHRHGAAVQTVAAPDGELLWVSGVLPGKTVDITAARRFGIAEKVLAFLGLLADLGYIGLHPQAITGYKRKRGEKTLPAGRKAANVALAGLRAIGERANAQLKCWRVLANDFRGSPRRITVIVKAVQTLQYLIRDPFGSARTVITS